MGIYVAYFVGVLHLWVFDCETKNGGRRLVRGGGQAVLILGDSVDKTVHTPKLHFSCVTESRAERLDHFIDFEFKGGKNLPFCLLKARYYLRSYFEWIRS